MFRGMGKKYPQKTKSEVVSIDGKTLCGSGGENSAIEMVSAWSNANQLVLGQVKADNEIKAVPKLLGILCLKGCIVTLDAMGCQKEISEKLTEKKADYVFSLKANHPDLHNDVKFYFGNERVKRQK